MYDQFEAIVAQQRRVFGWIERRMIKRIAAIAPDGFTMRGAGVEHQNAARSRAGREDWKHASLVIVPKMEEAVRGQHPVKPPT